MRHFFHKGSVKVHEYIVVYQRGGVSRKIHFAECLQTGQARNFSDTIKLLIGIVRYLDLDML